MNKKYGVVIALIVAIVLFVLLDGDEYLSLSALKESQVSLNTWQADNSLLFAVLFFIAYVVVTALSLPGAAVMTVAAGAFFGLGLGVLIVSFASSIGASCAFAVARYLFKESVQQRYAQRLTAINEGVRRDGLFYLFSLRLIPVFPFFLVNLVMALTPLRLRDFHWVSQLGMLPGTAVYVNAGMQLAELDSVSGVLSPALLASFSLLAVFPLLAKRFIEYVNRRKVYKPWAKPQKFDRNVIVLGGGAAGLVTSYIAAATQAKVTLV
ncbi:MAG: VTT domain-containing protein, partial [Spongiibacteraceae bacterium]